MSRITSPRLLNGCALGLVGAVLALTCNGCTVADRARQDLDTAATNISHPGAWLRYEFGGPEPAPPIQEGHSPDVDYSANGFVLGSPQP